MFKIFPRTMNGDQISLTFEYKEEKEAFERGLHEVLALRRQLLEGEESPLVKIEKSNEYLDKDGNLNGLLSATNKTTDKNIFTTLQVESLNNHKTKLHEIVGTHVCNIHGRASFCIGNYFMIPKNMIQPEDLVRIKKK